MCVCVCAHTRACECVCERMCSCMCTHTLICDQGPCQVPLCNQFSYCFLRQGLLGSHQLGCLTGQQVKGSCYVFLSGVWIIDVMWDSPLSAMNMFQCHWLIRNFLSTSGLTEYSQAGRDIIRESRWSQGEVMQPLQETDAGCRMMEPYRLATTTWQYTDYQKWVNLRCKSQLEICLSYWPNSSVISIVSV